MKDLKKIILAQDLEYKELEDGTLMIQKKEIAPFELELGKDYVSDDGKTIVIDRRGDGWNSGFYVNNFSTSLLCSNPLQWQEASSKQVREAFEKELVRRYGEDWRNVKIKECMYNKRNERLNTYSYGIYIKKNYTSTWTVWNKNGCLYNNGKWAEVLEEPKYAEKLEDIDRPWFIASNGSTHQHSKQKATHFKTEERAEQVFALIQLIAFRDDIWSKGGYGKIYGISYNNGKFKASDEIRGIFSFKDKETCEYFIEKHRDLLEVYSGVFKNKKIAVWKKKEN